MNSDGPSESVVMRHRGSDRAPRQKSSSTPSLLGRGDCSVPITCPRLGRPGALGSPTGSPFALILIDETSPVFRRTVASIRPWRRLIAEEGVVGVRACRSGRTDPVAGSFCVYLRCLPSVGSPPPTVRTDFDEVGRHRSQTRFVSFL